MLPTVRDTLPAPLDDAGSACTPPAVGRSLGRPSVGSDQLGIAAESLRCKPIKKRRFGTNQSGQQQMAGTITRYAASGPTVTAARPLRPHRRRRPASLQAQLRKMLDKTSRIGVAGGADSQATGPRPTKAASVPTQRLRERNLLWRPSRARCNRFRTRAGFRSGTQRKRGGTCRAKTGRSHEIGRESDRQWGSRVRYRRKRRLYVDLM